MTKRLAQGDDPLSVDLNTADFWVQLHQLPYGYANTGVATLLGNFVGAFLSYESAVQGGECRGYVHIRVAVNVRLSLKRSKKFESGMEQSLWSSSDMRGFPRLASCAVSWAIRTGLLF